MANENIVTYKIWAPADAIWSPWAKPVLFSEIQSGMSFTDSDVKRNFLSGDPPCLTALKPDTAVIVDLYGAQGVREGLGLAKLGYRPVPLYNGVGEKYRNNAVVNTENIEAALYTGAAELSTLEIASDAPPVFLLDANRMSAGKAQPGSFDNRWTVFQQDFPSAENLLAHGITDVVVRTASVAHDLQYVLHRYQDKKLRIFLCDGKDITRVSVHKPSPFWKLSYRFLMLFKLRRNAAGGFGGKVPDPQSSGYHGG